MSCVLFLERFQLVFGRFGFFQPFIFILDHFLFLYVEFVCCVRLFYLIYGVITLLSVSFKLF